jgi:hypothetical protein
MLAFIATSLNASKKALMMHVFFDPLMIVNFIVFTSIHASSNQPQILGFKLHI